jgi:hypothetical protein
MNFFKRILGSLAICGALASCNSAKTDDAQTIKLDTTQQHALKEAKGFHLYDMDFQMAALTYDGVLRGVDLLASKDDVKQAESTLHDVEYSGTRKSAPEAKLLEETADMLKYSFDMDPKEDAVVTYKFADGALKNISLLLHVDTNEQFEAMEAQFIEFFTHKFGTPTIIDGRQEVWKVAGSDTHEVDIIDQQKDGKFYLEVVVK